MDLKFEMRSEVQGNERSQSLVTSAPTNKQFPLRCDLLVKSQKSNLLGFGIGHEHEDPEGGEQEEHEGNQAVKSAAVNKGKAGVGRVSVKRVRINQFLHKSFHFSLLRCGFRTFNGLYGAGDGILQRKYRNCLEERAELHSFRPNYTFFGKKRSNCIATHR